VSLLMLGVLQLDLAEWLGCPVDLGERRSLKPSVAEAAERDLVRVLMVAPEHGGAVVRYPGGRHGPA
jgi:hypothetical protein